MLDLVLLYFLAKHIGTLAVKKGLPPLKWKLTMVALWLIFEMIGLFFAVAYFGTGDLVSLIAIGLASAFGGYLLIRYILEKKPDYNSYDEIDNIGKN